jgi:hypothetical protein
LAEFVAQKRDCCKAHFRQKHCFSANGANTLLDVRATTFRSDNHRES